MSSTRARLSGLALPLVVTISSATGCGADDVNPNFVDDSGGQPAGSTGTAGSTDSTPGEEDTSVNPGFTTGDVTGTGSSGGTTTGTSTNTGDGTGTGTGTEDGTGTGTGTGSTGG